MCFLIERISREQDQRSGVEHPDTIEFEEVSFCR